MSSLEVYLLSSAVLLILCVFASKATGRLGIPTLVVFLGVGILAGSEGVGGIQFDDAYAAQSLGIVALTYILFSGGLDTKWNSVRPVLKAGISLSTLGVFFTCLFVGVFIHYILHFSLLESFLIGAIISSTDAGAVFTVLRSKNINLKGHLKPLLELESGSNDPMAVFLTTTILQLMQMPRLKVTEMFPLLVQQMVLGAAIGLFLGKVLIFLFRRLKLEIEGLYLVFSIAAVMLIYSITQSLKGNGFLAVYVAGVLLGNDQFVLKKSLTLMHDGISWLMQSAMFLTLGLLIYPSKILNVAGPGILIAIFMILLARPLSVFLALSFSKTSTREKALISWVGLRGSVPVIMATYPLVAGIDRAGLIFNIVFFVALISLIIQGTSIHKVSKLLGVYDPPGIMNMNFSSRPGTLKEIVTIDIPLESPVIGKSLVELHLALKNILVVAIERRGEVIIPRGSSILREHDKLSLMADDEALADFMEIVWSKHTKIKTRFFWLPNKDETYLS